MLSGAATIARPVDLVGDGMSDFWEQKCHVPSSDAGKDYDGTGLTNVQKSKLGLDPHSSFSIFAVCVRASSLSVAICEGVPDREGQSQPVAARG
jgi:hypothetical protein